MTKKICIILLTIILGGWLVFALVIGIGNFYIWCFNHKVIVLISKIVSFALCIPLLSDLKK